MGRTTAVIEIVAQKELRVKTAWTGEGRGLVTTGVYRIIRRPVYLGNSL